MIIYSPTKGNRIYYHVPEYGDSNLTVFWPPAKFKDSLSVKTMTNYYKTLTSSKESIHDLKSMDPLTQQTEVQAEFRIKDKKKPRFICSCRR